MTTPSITWKGCLLLLASISYFLGLAPPNPPPQDKTSVYKGQLFERTFKLLIYAGQVCLIHQLRSLGHLNRSNVNLDFNSSGVFWQYCAIIQPKPGYPFG